MTSQRVKHIKRGTTYKVIGRGELQMSFDLLVDGSEMVVYQGEEDGKILVREVSEFDDPNRFEKLEPASVEPQRVYVVTGEHPWVSGVPQRVFGTLDGANKEAAEMVNLIREDIFRIHEDDRRDDIQEATSDNWVIVIEKLTHDYGYYYEGDFYVELRIEEVLP